MPTDLFRRCTDHIRRTEAADLGCDVSAFASNDLTIVPRPGKVLYPEYLALMMTFGTGTVVSIDQAYVDWARANPPAKHFQVFRAEFMAKLVAEAASRGTRTTAGGVTIGFAPSEIPDTTAPPAGFHLESRGEDWWAKWRPRRGFENAIGEPDEDDWYQRLVVAHVVSDDAGEPVAAAALVDDGNGSVEVGVDVRRDWRGLNLAPVVVTAATNWALAHGYVPYYTCSATNVRSHLVAERCGYRTLWAVTGVPRMP
jgi:GNAT superfamily N-acetyltransferase